MTRTALRDYEAITGDYRTETIMTPRENVSHMSKYGKALNNRAVSVIVGNETYISANGMFVIDELYDRVTGKAIGRGLASVVVV